MEKLRTPVIVFLFIAILAGGVALILRERTSSHPIEITLPPPSSEIEVYISGEVYSPGIYVLDEGARVANAVEAAGGLTPNADQAAVNLSRNLHDGAQLHVPKMGESSQRININTADAWLLDALDGIGQTLAERIIEYRTENGPFDSISELTRVKGISNAVFEKIKDKITVY